MLLYIVRGIPGSGKSEIAKLLSPDHSYSATDYYYNKKGEFKYSPQDVETAHKKCYKNVQNDMFDGVETIVVHNTFVHKWEYENYVNLAVKLGYDIREVICRGNSISKYDIPPKSVQKMLAEFEY